MQTFDLTCEFNLKAVVPERFLKDMRTLAQNEAESTDFLKRMQALYPEDDDAFVLNLLRHAIRRIVAGSIYDEFRAVGLGGTFSPATLRDRTPPRDAEPVLASALNTDQGNAT